MANLGLFNINTKHKYVKLSEIIGASLTSGTTYLMQLNSGACHFCESATKPTNGGFIVDHTRPFTYTSNGTELWVRTDYPTCINIAE